MIGSGNAFASGLAFAPNGTLYGSRGNSSGATVDIVTINTVTGEQTAVGGSTTVISDIWFSADGTLYAGSPNGDLYTVDPNTGDRTLLFNTDIRIAGLAGIESSVPETGSTFWLLLAVAGGLVIRQTFGASAKPVA